MRYRSKRAERSLRSWVVLSALLLTGCGDPAVSKDQTENTTTEITTEENTTEATEPESDLAAAKAGSLITFGHYEQDNDTSNGKEPIEWIVLEKRKDGSLLVVSRYALDVQPYNTERISVSWMTCTLRGWLNGTFLNTAFSQDEQAVISTDNPSNAEYTSYGADAEDPVFLFSIYEINETFAKDADGKSVSWMCKPTAYAKAQGIWTFDGGEYDGNCRWWLRSLGDDTTNAAYVGFNGSVYNLGRCVNRDNTAIRPALVIKPE